MKCAKSCAILIPINQLQRQHLPAYSGVNWPKVSLREGRDWAIRAGIRNRFNWTFEGSQPLPVVNDFASDDTMKIIRHAGAELAN
jgi:hypothetical protein